jgi:hypothetical protein
VLSDEQRALPPAQAAAIAVERSRAVLGLP